MLHLVVHTVETGHGTEARLLVVKVKLHVLLQSLQSSGVFRGLRDGQDVVEQDVMLLVDPQVVRGETLVPDVGLGDMVLQVTLENWMIIDDEIMRL